MPETTTVQAPISVAPRAVSQSLIDQYELPDEDFETPSAPAPADDTPARARGADGRFAVAEPVPVAAPVHSKLALKLADSFGITPEEAAGMAPDALEQTVAALHRQSLHGMTKLTKGEASGEREPIAPVPQAAQPEPLDLGDTSDWHPAIADAFKKLVGRLQAAEARLGEVHGIQQASIQETLNQRLDRLVSAHCDPALIGEGHGAEMDKESPEFLRRVSMIALAKNQSGNDAQKFQKAAAILRLGKTAGAAPASPAPATPPAAPAPAAAKNGHPTIEEWNEGGTARPTNRNGSAEPKGDGPAMAAVQQVMRAKGFNTRVEAEDEEADLPE